MQLVIVLEQIGGAVLFCCAVLAWAAMNAQTRHCFRLVYGVIGLAGLTLALDPFFAADLAPWARTALVAAFALHMLLDRRRIRPQRDTVPPMAGDPEATVRDLRRVALLAAVAVVSLWTLTSPADAAPIASSSGQGVTVVLTDEACALEAVGNLPARATWTEDGRLLEGCYAIFGVLIVAYFEDRAVVLIPARSFQRATGS